MCVLAKSRWWIDEGGGLETCLRQATPQDSLNLQPTGEDSLDQHFQQFSAQTARKEERVVIYETREKQNRVQQKRRDRNKEMGENNRGTFDLQATESRKKGKGRDVILFFRDKIVYATLARIMAVWEGV